MSEVPLYALGRTPGVLDTLILKIISKRGVFFDQFFCII